MRRRKLSIALVGGSILLISTALEAQPQIVRESFEAPAGWTWGLPTEVVDTGGSPAAYLVTSFVLDSALPKLRTGDGVDSPFVGDLRATKVRGVAVTLRIDAVPTPQGRDLSLELTNNGGTPGDPNDDCSVYFVGDRNIPLPGEGWVDYTFALPAARTTLPTGWRLLSAFGPQCPGLTNDEAWNLVVTDVDTMQFSYGDPSFFYIFQQWEGMALDNPTIASSP